MYETGVDFDFHIFWCNKKPDPTYIHKENGTQTILGYKPRHQVDCYILYCIVKVSSHQTQSKLQICSSVHF